MHNSNNLKFKNNVKGWGISKDMLHSKVVDGTYKILTLDIDFGYKCSLRCPHCFKNNFNHSEENGEILSFQEVKIIILQAKKLGLESIKILGAGEPFENEELLPFLQFLTDIDVHTCIFTKGHVLGDDTLARKYNEKHGIHSSKELVQKLFELNTSILLGYNSFSEGTQLKYCGISKTTHFDYFLYRNKALKNLIQAGFNQYEEGDLTRMALVAAPYKLENIDEIKEIYKWGRKQNIYVAICPSTVSGMGHKELERIKNNESNFLEKSISFYTDIYVWAIQEGYLSIHDFKEDGVSIYPGAHPCNQVAAGLYIIIDGKVMACPGLDGAEAIIWDNVRTKPLRDIWMESSNYKLAQQEKRFNFHCIAREKELFNNENFYDVVYCNVLNQM